MNVSHVVYAPLLGGPAHGQFALEVVGSPQGSPLPASELVRNLETWAIQTALKQPAIHFDFSSGLPETEEAWEIIGSCKDKGFHVRVTTDGQSRPPWFNDVHYRIAQISNEPWNQIPMNEIRYLPPNDEALSEPACGVSNQNTPRYVEVYQKLPGEQLLNFIQNAQAPWGLIIPPLRQYQLELFGGS